jgi:hypothetical protein
MSGSYGIRDIVKFFGLVIETRFKPDNPAFVGSQTMVFIANLDHQLVERRALRRQFPPGRQDQNNGSNRKPFRSPWPPFRGVAHGVGIP